MDIYLNTIALIDFLKIMKKCEIQCWLDGGSLLGVIRDGHLISYDVDSDVGVYFEEFNKKRELFYKEAQKIGFISKEDTNLFRQKFVKNNCKIDVFLFKKYKNLYYHRAFGGLFYWHQDLLDTLDIVKFEEYNCYVPHNPKEFLLKLYGKTWIKPITNMPKPIGYANFIKCQHCKIGFEIYENILDGIIIKKGII